MGPPSSVCFDFLLWPLFGIMHAVSSITEPALEETAAATATPKIFQLYVHGDMKWTEAIIGRAKKAGYAALALTVDVAHYSRREPPVITRYQPPTRRVPPNRKYLASLTWETGVTSIRQVTPKYVCKAEAVTLPHEMSGWVNMPVGRIL